jgi:hypothetical protein
LHICCFSPVVLLALGEVQDVEPERAEGDDAGRDGDDQDEDHHGSRTPRRAGVVLRDVPAEGQDDNPDHNGDRELLEVVRALQQPCYHKQ